MQLNTAQFFAALLGADGALTVTAGVVTLKSGDTFDVRDNVAALATVLEDASTALMDAADRLKVPARR